MRRSSALPRSAQNTVMDLLARREHSEKELRRKLRLREFSEDEISTALEKAKEGRWLGSPEETAQRFADQLHRKNKGYHYINAKLSEKGLPRVPRDESLELEKAKSLVQNKDFEISSREERLKATRFLMSRGFDASTIRKALKDEEEL